MCSNLGPEPQVNQGPVFGGLLDMPMVPESHEVGRHKEARTFKVG